jgi:hypothetical protein
MRLDVPSEARVGVWIGGASSLEAQPRTTSADSEEPQGSEHPRMATWNVFGEQELAMDGENPSCLAARRTEATQRFSVDRSCTAEITMLEI